MTSPEGCKGAHVCDNLYEDQSNTVILVWQGEGVRKFANLCEVINGWPLKNKEKIIEQTLWLLQRVPWKI